MYCESSEFFYGFPVVSASYLRTIISGNICLIRGTLKDCGDEGVKRGHALYECC